ncbi:hypothetical protein C6Q17_24295 [Burkholderia contaminans]|nr:hypothetical protein C6Q17_24295 [Burkholderia contaminans]
MDPVTIGDVASKSGAQRWQLVQGVACCLDQAGCEFLDRLVVGKQSLHLGSPLPENEFRCRRIQRKEQSPDITPSFKFEPKARDVVERMRCWVEQIQ